MYTLVVNAGSSSVKFTCFGPGPDEVLAQGMVERIGLDGTRLHYQPRAGEALHQPVDTNHTGQALRALVERLTDARHGVLDSPDQVAVVAHRVVHGGEKINQPVIIDEAVKAVIREHFALAPLHNPPNLAGIEAAQEVFPDAVQVGVFDTAFHRTLPAKAYLYALPRRLYEDYRIRRYGFHGISHQYVSRIAAKMLGREPAEVNLVTCHLGNGCSITAVQGGRSVDTSMGFTPLEGLVMGTRTGDLDPAIVIHLVDHHGMSLDQVKDLLNKQSGLLGLSGGRSSDLRDIATACQQGDATAQSALEVFCYRIKKYLGAYAAAMGSVDAVVFTGGIGENSPLVRQMALEGLAGLGITLDHERNQAPANGARAVHAASSLVSLLVVPTNEEKEMAGQARSLLP